MARQDSQSSPIPPYEFILATLGWFQCMVTKYLVTKSSELRPEGSLLHCMNQIRAMVTGNTPSPEPVRSPMPRWWTKDLLLTCCPLQKSWAIHHQQLLAACTQMHIQHICRGPSMLLWMPKHAACLCQGSNPNSTPFLPCTWNLAYRAEHSISLCDIYIPYWILIFCSWSRY